MLLDTPQIRMSDDFSCGTTASRILFGYSGLEFPADFISLASPVWGTSPETTSAIIGSGFGGMAEGTGWTIADLEMHLSLDRPVMCLVSVTTPNDHWVVVRGVQAGRVFLQDPDRGRHSLGFKKWLKLWNGPENNPYAGFSIVGWLV